MQGAEGFRHIDAGGEKAKLGIKAVGGGVFDGDTQIRGLEGGEGGSSLPVMFGVEAAIKRLTLVCSKGGLNATPGQSAE